MSFYFLNESIRNQDAVTVPSLDFPVIVKTSTWEHLEDPNRISKNFSFTSSNQMRYFISEIFDIAETRDHDIKIVIEGKKVTVETYTHDLQDITDLDLLIARECDQIFFDSKYVGDQL